MRAVRPSAPASCRCRRRSAGRTRQAGSGGHAGWEPVMTAASQVVPSLCPRSVLILVRALIGLRRRSTWRTKHRCGLTCGPGPKWRSEQGRWLPSTSVVVGWFGGAFVPTLYPSILAECWVVEPSASSSRTRSSFALAMGFRLYVLLTTLVSVGLANCRLRRFARSSPRNLPTVTTCRPLPCRRGAAARRAGSGVAVVRQGLVVVGVAVRLGIGVDQGCTETGNGVDESVFGVHGDAVGLPTLRSGSTTSAHSARRL